MTVAAPLLCKLPLGKGVKAERVHQRTCQAAAWVSKWAKPVISWLVIGSLLLHRNRFSTGLQQISSMYKVQVNSKHKNLVHIIQKLAQHVETQLICCQSVK